MSSNTASDPNSANSGLQSPHRKRVRPRDALRAAVEIVLTLMIAVWMFKYFLVEGYMVKTGSMAPTIRGFHKQVVCPVCGFGFGRNVPWNEQESRDEAEDRFGQGDLQGHRQRRRCICPNCGEDRIDI